MLALEGGVRGVGRVGGAVHPVGYWRPVGLENSHDDVARALALAHGDGEADPLIATGGDDGVVVEAASSG